MTFSGEDHSRYPSTSDEELSNVSSQIPGQDADKFMLQYLHLPEPMLSHIKHTERGDSFKIMFDSLVRWRNMQECNGENVQMILQDIMEQFHKQSPQHSYGFQIETSRIEQIQTWTRESIQRKPFCLAISKSWTAKPHKFPLELTYTKLEWVKRNRLPSGTVREQISDITDLLDEKQLGTTDPVRVLITGQW